jgi:hypothetical protein
MNKALIKYKIGFGVILLFTLVILGYLLVQANKVKYDNNLAKEATKVANQLNTYTDDNGVAPQSLSQVGIKSYSGITYRATSYNSYEFCVKYKTSVSNVSATSVEQQIQASEYGYSDTQTNYNNASDGFSDLEIYPGHSAGNNCQSIDVGYSNSNPSNGY